MKVFMFLHGSFCNILFIKCSKLLCIASKVMLCNVTPFSVQILHQLPEGGGEPVSPSSEGFLRAAAGHNGGEWSNHTEDEGRRRRYREIKI